MSEVRALIHAVQRGEPGAGGVLGDYLIERGWRPMRLQEQRPATVLETLLERGAWPERALHRLACAFASRVLPLYEEAIPRDHRPRKAITAKLRWLERAVSTGELTDARAACARAEERCQVQRVGLAPRAAAGAAFHAASGARSMREPAWQAANRAAAALAHRDAGRGADDTLWRASRERACALLLELLVVEFEALGK